VTLDAADFAAFVDSDMPGYALATIGAEGVPGLFSNNHKDAFGLVSSSTPNFMAPPSLVSAVSRGDAISINAVSYTVVAIEASGQRLTRLFLERA
jgi:hypothetical protein